MIVELWAYHWRMGRAVERLYRQAMFDRIMGSAHMQAARSELKFFSGEQWSIDEMMIMRRRS